MSQSDCAEMKGNIKRKSKGTGRNVTLGGHESREDRPAGAITINDLESKPAGTSLHLW